MSVWNVSPTHALPNDLSGPLRFALDIVSLVGAEPRDRDLLEPLGLGSAAAARRRISAAEVSACFEAMMASRGRGALR